MKKRVKLKKYVGWWEAGHNENECRNLSAGVEEDLEASVTELSGGRGTGVLRHAAEQNACLLHEDGSDQSVHSCPSPTDGGGDDLENLAASSSLQAWFDTEVLEVRENDNLDAIATTEQRPKTTFRPDVQVEPSEEVQTTPNPSRVLIFGKLSVSSRKKRDRIDCSRWLAGRQKMEDAFERCRWVDSVHEISRKDREAAEKQA